jgi:ADP-ribose pyrophosphatase
MEKWTSLKKEETKVGYRTLISETYRMPDGTDKVFTIYKEHQSACAVVVTPEGKVVFARQYRPGPRTVLDELPGGMIDENEDPADAVEREVLEETGYSGECVPLGKSFKHGYSTGIQHHFLIKNAVKTASQELDSCEFIEVIEQTREDFLSLVLKGDLTDQATALLAIRHLGW